MILLLSGIFLLLTASGSLNQFSPYFLNDLFITSAPPPCFEAKNESGATNDSSRDSLTVEEPGRAANFTLRGQYLCQHQIFEHGERDGFADFLAAQAQVRAQSVAQVLYRERLQSGAVELDPIALSVEAKAPAVDMKANSQTGEPSKTQMNPHISAEMTELVRTIFAGELTETLGAGSVARQPSNRLKKWLRIQIARVDSPDVLLQISVGEIDSDGIRQWRPL